MGRLKQPSHQDLHCLPFGSGFCTICNNRYVCLRQKTAGTYIPAKSLALRGHANGHSPALYNGKFLGDIFTQ